MTKEKGEVLQSLSQARINQVNDRLFDMCGGIEYESQKVFFPQPGARLPVRLRDGNVTWITWGMRKNESIAKFPNGG